MLLERYQLLVVLLGAVIVSSHHLVLQLKPFINFFAVSCHLIKDFLILLENTLNFKVVLVVMLDREDSNFLFLLLGSQTISIVFNSDGVKERPSYRRISVLWREKGGDFLVNAGKSYCVF